VHNTQRITGYFGGHSYWFSVYRFDTEQEIIQQLHYDKVEVPKKISAVTTFNEKWPEIGRMYLLDKSVHILASQAFLMAMNIVTKTKMVDTAATPEGLKEVAALVGEITSSLYSHSRHF
jgi:hypothetical protein